MQSSVASMVRRLKGRDVWDYRSLMGVNHAFKVRRTNDGGTDDGASLMFMGNDLQDKFAQGKHLDQCKLTCYSFACPALLLAWMWHTADNLEKRAARDAKKMDGQGKKDKWYGSGKGKDGN